MTNPSHLVRVSLGAVVLDTPDESGCFVASDAVGGWAYLVTDDEGDHRFRGEGTCLGGIDMCLSWAVLAAIAHVPDSRRIKLLVGSRLAQAAMERLARVDELITGAMKGREMTLQVRPEEKSVRRVMSMAEQVASTLLRERERDRETADERAPVTRPAAPSAARSAPARAAGGARAMASLSVARPSATPATPPKPAPEQRISLFAPMMTGLRDKLGLRRKPERNQVLASWLKEMDDRVAAVKAGLDGVGE